MQADKNMSLIKLGQADVPGSTPCVTEGSDVAASHCIETVPVAHVPVCSWFNKA